MIRVLVVEDNKEVSDKVIIELNKENMFEVVGLAQTSDSAYDLCKQLLPDIVLLDLHLPGLTSIYDLIKKLNHLANAKIVAYASNIKPSVIHTFINSGVSAYIHKEDSMVLLKMTMLMVKQGKQMIYSPNLPKNILKLNDTDRHLLNSITQRGQIKKAAIRLGYSQAELEGKLAIICDKLEIYDKDNSINVSKLVKWAKDNGF